MDKLAILATGMPLAAAFDDARASQRWLDDVAAHAKSLDDYVDALLTTRGFAEGVAPRVFVGDAFMRSMFNASARKTLQRTTDGVYYLTRPCALHESVKVRPWWDIEHEVQVCADSYRPEVSRYTDGGQTAYCGALWKDTEPCGCGPNLLRCSRDDAHEKQLRDVAVRELTATTAFVVRSNLPVASLFTGTRTVRDWQGEVLYRELDRDANAAGDLTPALRDLASWRTQEARERSERWPGQHAGILTSPVVLQSFLDSRQMLREVYSMMWCSTVESRGATARAVLDLHTSDLSGRHAKWQELARRPVCTTCHARLDYGMQFFRGYGDSRLPGLYALPELVVPGAMQLFGNDIDDPRGEAPASPAGFAKLATAQPEFAQCMSQHVLDRVLGHEATPDDVAAERAAYVTSPTPRQLFKTALGRYVQHWKRGREAAPAPASASARPDLRELVDKFCMDCHDEQAPRLERPSPALLVDMSVQVAFGSMPKGDTDMTVEDRDALVSAALALALPADDHGYFLGKQSSLGAHEIDDAFELIDRSTRSRTLSADWALHERDIGIGRLGRIYTPSFAAATGFKAVRACHAAKLEGAALEACVEKVTDPKILSTSARPYPP